MQETATINPARIAAGPVNETPLAFHETLAPSKRPIQPLLLNEGEAAALFGVGRRKFHDVRQQPWFVEVCTARELGPRALRWPRDELMAAAMNAPRLVKRTEPEKLAAARTARKAA